jgi:TonB family protein
MRHLSALLLAVLATQSGMHASSTWRATTQNVRLGNASAIPNGIVTPPQIITHPKAEYTEEARRLGVQGSVVVQAQFDADGNFKVLRIVKGLGFGLDENALAALRNWRFQPAVRNGERVSVIAEIEVPFELLDADRSKKLRNAVEGLKLKLEEMRKLHQKLHPAAHN